MSEPERLVICGDAFERIQNWQAPGSIITSLPDADDHGWTQQYWRDWFGLAVQLCLRATPDDALCIFYQTDRKFDGRQIAKDRYIMDLARGIGYGEPLWHKIALTRPIERVSMFRPAYSHMLAFSMKAGPGPATPDVMPAGRKLYPDGMGCHAALFMAKQAERVSSHVTDPFCGRGTILAAAEAIGLDSLGIDIDLTQCERARSISMMGMVSAGTTAS
jgi:hypothetical protein